MKILRVVANNRKKEIVVETKRGRFIFPFTKLRLRPSAVDPITEIYPDTETGHEAFTYLLRSGKEDTIHVDQVLAYNEDPEYVREELLFRLSMTAQESIRKQRISKRFLARRLNTSPAHIHRLLDQTYYGKTIDQMIRLLAVLGQTVNLQVS